VLIGGCIDCLKACREERTPGKRKRDCKAACVSCANNACIGGADIAICLRNMACFAPNSVVWMFRFLACPVISVIGCAGKTVVGCGNLVCGDPAEFDCNEDPRCCKNGAFCLDGCTFGMDKTKKILNWTDCKVKVTDCCQWSCKWENLDETCKSWCWLDGFYKMLCSSEGPERMPLVKGCRWKHITDLLSCCDCLSCSGCMRNFDSDLLECLFWTAYYTIYCLGSVAGSFS